MRSKSLHYNKGIVLPQLKGYVLNPEVITLGLPQRVAVALKQSKGPEPIVMVEKNEKIKIGTILAKSTASTITSPVSGRVLKFEKRPSCYGGLCKHIIIEVDPADEAIALPKLEGDTLTVANIIKRINDLGIVDYDGIPLQNKLKKDEFEVKSLVINACTDEPFMYNNLAIVKSKAKEIVMGAMYLAFCLELNKVKFVISKDKIDLYSELIEQLQKNEDNYIFELDGVPNRYPIGDQVELVKCITGKEVSLKQDPRSLGVAIIDIYTCFTVCEAVNNGLVDYSKLVTIVGTGINGNEIQNAWVRVGTTLENVMRQTRQCGERNIVKILAGGPMRGVAVADLSASVTKQLKGIMFLNGSVLSMAPETACIGCGKCADVCPRHLLPYKLDRLSIEEDYVEAKRFGAEECSKCGCCSYICPAKRHLVQRIAFAKDTIKNKEL